MDYSLMDDPYEDLTDEELESMADAQECADVDRGQDA